MQKKLVCCVPANRLRALLQVAARKNDPRPEHAVVCFDTTSGRLVATDGHMAFIISHGLESSTAPFSVSREALESALRLMRPTSLADVDVRISEQEGHAPRDVLLSVNGAIVPTHERDVRCKGYERLIPQHVTGEPGQFDASLTERLQEAFRLATNRPKKNSGPLTYLAHNGPDCVGVMVCPDPDIIGLIMPFRNAKGADDLKAALERHSYKPPQPVAAAA